MDFEEIKAWYLKALRAYTDFEGRSRRKEYWTFTLVNFVISMLLSGLGLGMLGLLFGIVILLPGIAVGVRRLHDIGKSGLWLLVGFIPVVGLIVLIYFFIQDSEPGANMYGVNPKGI